MGWRIISRYEEDDTENYDKVIQLAIDDNLLRRMGNTWLEILGKLDLYDYTGRAIISRRLRLIDARRAELMLTPPF